MNSNTESPEERGSATDLSVRYNQYNGLCSSSWKEREPQLTRIKIKFMIKLGANGQVIKNNRRHVRKFKIFYLNCLLLLYVDSNWFTPRAKLILKRMEKITYQPDPYTDISENLHRGSKDTLDYKILLYHTRTLKWATVYIKAPMTVGRNWSNISDKNEGKWDPPSITYGCLWIYSVVVEICKSDLFQYPSVVTAIWRVAEAWDSIR